MSKRITLEEAKQKQQHKLEIREQLKNGSYRSNRFSSRLEKRVQKEGRWFNYIKSRGGIKEKKEEKKDVITTEREEKTYEEQGKEMQREGL